MIFSVVSNGVSVSVMEGDSVTLNTGVEIKQQEDIKWYFNDICIAQNSGDQNKSKICTDDQYEDADVRFRDRLKLDHQTGSLTITNTTNTHSGVYKLQTSSSIKKVFIVSVHGVSGVNTDRVSVMEGDSVTLNTGVQTNQQDRIRWYYNDIRIAQINRDLSKICTDVQCNEGTERFRDRLKLDHQTGSLTIMNITNTDSGEYQLQISSGSSDSENTFNVILYGVSAAERDTIKRKTVMEGESVTLYTGVIRKLNDSITWYINEILIAEISVEPRKTCTDDQCEERFRDRLKLDHQTGSLTITHTRNTDSGEYKLQINNSRFSINKSFSVSVTAVPDSGLSSAAVGGICAAVILLVAVTVTGIYCFNWKSRKRKAMLKRNRTTGDDRDQENNVPEAVPLNQRTETPLMDDDSGTSQNETETPLMDDENGMSHNKTETPQVDDDNGTETPLMDDDNGTEAPLMDDDNGTSQNETETPLMDDENGTSHNKTETPQVDDDNETETPLMDDDNGTSYDESESPQVDDDNGTSQNETETQLS